MVVPIFHLILVGQRIPDFRGNTAIMLSCRHFCRSGACWALGFSMETKYCNMKQVTNKVISVAI